VRFEDKNGDLLTIPEYTNGELWDRRNSLPEGVLVLYDDDPNDVEQVSDQEWEDGD
jgi:hypothetical protein